MHITTIRRFPRETVLVWVVSAVLPSAAAEPDRVTFSQGPGTVQVAIGGRPVARYVYRDEAIARPYFCGVRAPGGIQATRNHPPIEGKDPTDHATMHPGIWMAFGDLGGSDFWRNRARVVHAGFIRPPTDGRGKGTFAVRNRYLAPGDEENAICEEVCRFTFLVRSAGTMLIWDSTFSAAGGEFSFGDQEEMGLGIRVASPIRVKAGGTMLDAKGRRNEKEVWGNASDWCDYSGTIDGRRVGITLMCDPANFRPSWFHARDYGALVANPFGRRAFGKGDTSKVTVKSGRPLRLRYGVLLHSGPAGSRPKLKAAYDDFIKLVAAEF